MIFNTATYLVIGILLREPRSGYDIVKELAGFRPAKSSQIYPILAKLEKNDYINCEQVQQDSKPNKKVYTVTDKGKKVLDTWLDTTPEIPVIRDDFLSMFFSVWIKDPTTLIKMVNQRLEYLHKTLTFFNDRIQTLENCFPTDIHNFYSWRNCTYFLYKRRIAMTQEDIKWCEYVLSEQTQNRKKTEI